MDSWTIFKLLLLVIVCVQMTTQEKEQKATGSTQNILTLLLGDQTSPQDPTVKPGQPKT